MTLLPTRAALVLVVLATSLTPQGIWAQTRPTVSPTDYGRWESVAGVELDADGRWVVTSIRTVDGDVELRVHRTDGTGEPFLLERGTQPAFAPDGQRLVYLREADDDADDGTPDSERQLAVLDLDAGVDSVLFASRRFALSGDGHWVASLGAPASDSTGGDLTIVALASGRRTTLGNVDDFAWRDTGALLALTLRTASGVGNGVTLFDPASGAIAGLDGSTSRYRNLTWRDDSGDLAVLRSFEVEGRDEVGHDVVVWRDLAAGRSGSAPGPRVLSTRGRSDLSDTLRILDSNTPTWSADGGTVFVGLRPWSTSAADASDTLPTTDAPPDTVDADAADAADDDPGPSPVQVWHWNDDRILRAQESSEASDARRTLLAAWHLDDDRLVLLGAELDEPVRLTADGRWGLVSDVDPYAFERRFGASTQDLYRVDVESGERQLVAAGIDSPPVLGPVGARILIYQDDAWLAVDLASLARTALGTDVEVEFTQPLDVYDYPGARPPFGVGGWADDESRAYLHDRHDVWEADLASGALTRRTPGAEDGLEYRVINLDPDASAFDLTAAGLELGSPLWLRISDPRTMASGYGRTTGATREVARLVFEDAAISRLTRADDAPRYALVKERYDDSPDVFVGGADLDDLLQIGATNPFQSEFAWGRNELLSYTTDAGHDLHAILTYPADYDASRSYPMILYQYERLSQGLHRYVTPARTSYYNVQVWSQAGYFVLQPDIVYEPGRPGPSAVDAVSHALDAALAAAPIDPERMGLIGHSWGGYQAAYLPTRMHRFAASVAGAAITNFLSFPGTVHWNGGLPELGHWETGQARMARPPWEDLAGHLESSPVAAIDELRTPMLLMHGDADGVVDFRQGLEFYNYARRLGKEVVLLVYPGADHGLRKEENQVDYQTRILQWFAHYLKGEPAARWITDGEDWNERAKRIGG